MRLPLVFLALFCALGAARAQVPLRHWVPGPSPDSLAVGYYVVDSDDPATPLRPSYMFVDTLYQRSSWHRIAASPLLLGGSQGAAWQVIGGDSTDNTFAGPIAIGFSFPFYGTRYDSVYLSSNGYIGFGSRTRAGGGDGPAFTTFAPGSLPNTAAPKAIAAFMMTDAEMVRRGDSSRAFYRTNSTNDSFFISIYGLFHASGASTVRSQHRFGVDVQIVLARADSSITFHYRKFSGGLVVGLTTFATEPLFRNGCIPMPCEALQAVIGMQSDSRVSGTTYMAHGAFTVPARVTELHGGLAVKFLQLTNPCRADSVYWPPNGIERMVGDTITLSARFRNVSPSTQTFFGRCRVRNASTGAVLFADSVLIANLPAHATRNIVFRSWRSDTLRSDNVGALGIEAIAAPIGDSIGLARSNWGFDDTIRQSVFVVKRLTSFSDFSSRFSSSQFRQGSFPDDRKWVNHGATVIDGDGATWLPLPPRGKQPASSGGYRESPVIVLDRLDENGIPYDACAATGGGAIGDRGVGDTIVSFPIDIAALKHALLAFSYERAGRKSYPRWYDRWVAYGPERTVTDPTHTTIYRAGDSLVLDFAGPQDSVNGMSWREMWACDGGKDFMFNRVFIPIDSQHATHNFRFRLRLNAKDDFGAVEPHDDYDEWFVDNVLVIDPNAAEVEVSSIRVAPEWAYSKAPASQATAIPLELRLVNNGGIVTSGFGIAVRIYLTGNPKAVYEKLMTFPLLAPGKTLVSRPPPWDGWACGPGPYTLSASLQPKGYDAEPQNDSTFSQFVLSFDSSFVYNTYDQSYDFPQFTGVAGMGLNMREHEMSYGDTTGASGTGSGSIAVKFTVVRTDTMYGVQVNVDTLNYTPDSIRISIHYSLGDVPGDVINDSCASFVAVRADPQLGIATYTFPCKRILLPPGDYWASVSQLGDRGFQLAASSNRASCDWVVWDSLGNNDSLVMNYPEMQGRFAYETVAGSGRWTPFYRADGKPAFCTPDSISARRRILSSCGKNVPYFYGQGSWMPDIRPFFGLRQYWYKMPPDFNPSWLDKYQVSFIAHAACTAELLGKRSTITVHFGDALETSFALHFADSHDTIFRIVGPGTIIVKGESAPIIVECRARRAIKYTDTLYIGQLFRVPLSAIMDTLDIMVSPAANFGKLPIGSTGSYAIAITTRGVQSDTLSSVRIDPWNSAFTCEPPRTVIGDKSTQYVMVQCSPRDTGRVETNLEFTFAHCGTKRTTKLIAIGTEPSAIATTTIAPANVQLFQNMPNPFGEVSTIAFDIPRAGHVRLVVRDMLGMERMEVCNELLPAGYHEQVVHSDGLAPGAYIYVLTAGNDVVSRMMMVAK